MNTPPAGLMPGDQILVRAIIQPPPPPAAPGAFDFQRQAWFDRLGAVGYAVGGSRRLDVPGGERSTSWRLWLNAQRQSVVERILAVVPGPAGAIIAALVTGEMGAITRDVMEAMRDSGLAHLLSISGLHIGLVAGCIFLVVRQVLALIPRIALNHPIKKWAAIAAWLAITFYTLFTNPSVPTQRSWLMTSLVIGAILVDRTAISMRLVAWAALVVLIAFPEALLGPSLQMSFAAVVALIAAWEVARVPLARLKAATGLAGRFGLILIGSGMTTLVAGFASAPYALYHFNRFALYGILANMLAVPLTGIWVMPLVVVAFLLLPFGLERFALVPMAWGVEAIIWIARAVAGLSGASTLLPAMPVWGLAAVTIGGLWLCLWRRAWRLAGVPVIMIGLASVALELGPDVLVSSDGGLFAVRGPDGMLQLSNVRRDRLTRETWLRRSGQERPVAWTSDPALADAPTACDAQGCIYRAKGHVVALVNDVSALVDDCARASVVIATVPVRQNCPSASVVIDRFALWRDGGHAIWLKANSGVTVESVRGWRGERPWVPPPPGRRAPQSTQKETPPKPAAFPKIDDGMKVD
jgi:competence protein ComEC